MKALPERPWARPGETVLGELNVTAEKGLSATEARRRSRQYGLNRLREAKKKSAWSILTDQFKNFIIALLAAAAALSFAFGDWLEGLAIVAVILINATIGFVTELRAVRSMEALHRLGSVTTKVRRDGSIHEVPAERLVPGDIVILEGGDIVTADLRIIYEAKLQADESALTGESLPVSKNFEPLGEDTHLPERKNMLFKGTAVTRGTGEAVIVATGMNTELGRISTLVEEAEEEVTPLEKRLNKLAHKLIWAVLAIAVLIAVLGIITGKEMLLMIETSIALAVAAIPEGLPIVATIALARGMWRMARRNALVNRLSAVETLGATNVICTDKTGTLTENLMTVTRFVLDTGNITVNGNGNQSGGAFSRNGSVIDPAHDAVLHAALFVSVLCNNASITQGSSGDSSKAVGDPLEVALLVAASKAGIHREDYFESMPEEREEAFDSDIKMMATFNKDGERYRVAVKGAPETILESCTSIMAGDGSSELSDEVRSQWMSRNDEMAGEGLRVLALATKTVEALEAKPYEGLQFLGLVGMLDPPRSDVHESLEKCRSAGIEVIMVTGDQAVTARNVGLAVGLIEEENAAVVNGQDLKSFEALSEDERRRLLGVQIFARVSPKQKLDLIALHQENGSIVAMTGDGVNDAPALKKADIGVAMGVRGTQVAREAAHMVLKDDAFSTIIAAVEQGRVIFANIRKSILYLLSCNVSEIMIVALASLVNAPLPILPLQILFLNLVTDVFPALALGVGEGDPDTLNRPPRDPKDPVLTKGHWLAIGGYGIAMTIAVLGALSYALVTLNMEERQAVTVSFLTLAFAQLWHVFNMRDRGSGFFSNDITRNRYIWGSLLLCVGLLLAAVYLPGLATVLKVVDPGPNGWALILIMSFMPWVIGQISKIAGRRQSG